MQRSSIIATVVAAGGVLIAGSAASVAVINAASINPPQSESIAVVAAGASSPSPTASVETFVASAPTPVATPTLDAAELPELPDVTSTAKAAAARTNVAPAASPARTTSRDTSSQASAQANKPKKPSKPASQSPAAVISSDQARDIVLTATGGGDLKNIARTTRGQHRAWAVQVLRHDGSLVTGYVDTAKGVIFDWVVDVPAPAPQHTSDTSGSEAATGEDSGESDDD